MKRKISAIQSNKSIIQIEKEKLYNNLVHMVGKYANEIVDQMGERDKGEYIEIQPQDISSQSILKQNKKKTIDEAVERIIESKFSSFLHDIDYRINTMQESFGRLNGSPGAKVSSHDLNIATHILDGFTFTPNSPSAGYVAWAGCHIVYKGTDVTITNANTNLKYIWWDYDANPNTAFQTSDTKPTLAIDDVLIAINDSGTPTIIITSGKLLPGSAIADSTIDSGEIKNSAITSTKVATDAITEAKVAAGAITEAKVGAGAIAEAKLNIATHMMY